MANKTVCMLRIRKLIQLLDKDLSQRKISSELKMGRNILSGYISRIEQTALSYQSLLGMDDSTLASLLTAAAAELPADPRLSDLTPRMENYVHELNRTGVTKKLLWEEYQQEVPGGYGYTQFKEHLNRYLKNHDYSYHNHHAAARQTQVDFCGDPLCITNQRTGVINPCPVLVCTLPCTSYVFAIALHDSRQESFYYALGCALDYFGGVTESVKSDNMRQWVKRADRYEPTFTEATLGWGVYYQTELLASRVYKPRDKGHIESHVNIIYREVYAHMRNQTFYSLDALNSRILELLEQLNHKKMQGHDYSRYDRFIREEKPLLRVLPGEPYVFRYSKGFTVNSTYHVQLVTDRHFYSVPYQYIGAQATMIYDYRNVEIYIGLERVTVHVRSYEDGYTTKEEHMPERHRAYKRTKEYNAAYYLGKASGIGPCTKEVIGRILDSKIFVQQSYLSCQGILSLVRKYPVTRIESACERARTASGVTYQMIRQILVKNLDTIPQSEQAVSYLPEHENIRGASAWQ